MKIDEILTQLLLWQRDTPIEDKIEWAKAELKEIVMGCVPKPPMVDGQDVFQRGKLLGWVEALSDFTEKIEGVFK